MAVKVLPLAKPVMLDMFDRMVTIRFFEERVIDLFREGVIRGSTHTYIGMEADAVGACTALRSDDYITSTHRGHGHCIAKGGDVRLMMAELLGKATGYCKGKGGSMHIADLDVGILGANGIVGGGMGIATGAGLSSKMRGSGQVAVCFFGDGGINQGAFHENANIASIWKLPVIFFCENNQYAMSMSSKRANSVEDLSVRAVSYNMPGVTVDGMDVLAVEAAINQAVERARAGEGPSLIVATTYRFEGHNIGDTQPYRTQEEVDEWRKRDSIERFRQYLIKEGVATAAETEAIEKKVRQRIDEAEQFARESPEPELSSVEEDVYA
ncbi:MAG TPA: thiamine pyrophosphate-dependent dehydrogenase E1 component subunit alpha [Chloroflexota bacterium]|nr:thiamine pyrophosphate-dependent dehydrogenase E1 component subunit alpha [Chloroflexota bacterium]